MKIEFNPVLSRPMMAASPAGKYGQYANLAPLGVDTVSFTGVGDKSKVQKKSVKDLSDNELYGKKVLMRVDFNVPVNMDDSRKITEDIRIRAAIPTIKYLQDKGAKVILISHFEGKDNDKKEVNRSLDIAAVRLSELLKEDVKFCPETVGPVAEQAVNKLNNGQVILMENTRYNSGEKKNDPEFSKQLAKLADVYVNDAFGTAHRAHASTSGVAQVMRSQGKPAVLGLLMEKEVSALGGVMNDPKRPFTAIIGGAKVSDKIEVVNNLLDNALQQGDNLIIGGGMPYTFLLADGIPIGKSICEPDKVNVAREIMEKAAKKGVNLILPNDVLITDDFSGNGTNKFCSMLEIPEDFQGVDAGPKTCELFKKAIGRSQTILWNGPVGVFEKDVFDKGTRTVALAVAEATKNGATTVIGGGDSVTAINKFEIDHDNFSHVSTGGGASLEFMEGKTLPGVDAVDDK